MTPYYGCLWSEMCENCQKQQEGSARKKAEKIAATKKSSVNNI